MTSWKNWWYTTWYRTTQPQRCRKWSCQKMSFIPKESVSVDDIVSGGETKQAIDKRMQDIIKDFPSVFADNAGRFRGEPIKIQVKSNAVPVIQALRRIPLHYRERAKAELKKMISGDIIEGPIDIEEPGTFLSNLAITDKKVLIKSGLHWTVKRWTSQYIQLMNLFLQWRNYDMNSEVVTDFRHSISQIVTVSLRQRC